MEIIDPSVDGVSSSTELDRAFQVELNLAQSIRDKIEQDLQVGRFSKFEMMGRLGMNQIEFDSMSTRKTWTLRFAILIANRLGYNISSMELRNAQS